MCDLCTSSVEVKQKAKLRLYEEAERLDRMATYLRSIADGSVKPHSEEAGRYAATARATIRYLVDEWM